MSTYFDDRDGIIWIDGQYKDWRACKLHVITHGLHYGSSVFEGIRMYNGKIFKNREHMERLIFSANALDMKIDYSVEDLMAHAQAVCEKNNLTDAYLRPIIWRGSEAMGVDARGALPHIAIAAWYWGSYFGEAAEKGISLVTVKWRKPPPGCVPYEAKCGGIYVTNSLNKHEAVDKGYNDALVLDWRGQVCESSGANLFAMIDGVLKTPIADCFLNGITRQTVIQLCKDLDVAVEECVIMPKDLEKATEVFVTGTAAEVTPVSKINDTVYTVGATTKKLQEAYNALTH
jgi:branched-chain amino acid aminotransferase